MSRSPLNIALIAAGLCLLLAGLGVWAGPGTRAAYAQRPQQRPTLTPQPTHTPTPHNRKHPTPTATGRITGTVIDLTSGAPAPGIAVAVGDVVVTTDSNGNYDRSGLPAGAYRVELMLRSEQGTSEQGSLTVDLADGATVVHHLAFRSPAPAPPAAPAEVPRRLPATGRPDDASWWPLALGLVLLVLGVTVRRSTPAPHEAGPK